MNKMFGLELLNYSSSEFYFPRRGMFDCVLMGNLMHYAFTLLYLVFGVWWNVECWSFVIVYLLYFNTILKF